MAVALHLLIAAERCEMRALFRIAAVFVALFLGMARCGDSPNGPSPVCDVSLSPANSEFGADGGTGMIAVNAPAGCAWTATSGVAWLNVSAGASGSGSGTVTYAVSANATADVRNGAVTVGGQTHSVRQQGRTAGTCSYQLSPGEAEFEKDSGSGAFTVTAPAGCTWSASSNATWVLITSDAEGTGTATVAYVVSRNEGIERRSAAIAVADRTFVIRQEGDLGRCEYAVAPVDFAPCMPAGSVEAAVTTQASCPWTATPNASWLTLRGGESGTGSAVITIAFSENYDAPRNGLVMVRWPTPTAGQNIRIAQAGCLYGVSRTDFSFAAAGGAGTFDVLQQSIPIECGSATQDRCVWSAVSNVPWVVITSSMPRSGDNPVAFTVAANDTAQSRTGQITVRNQVVIVTQAGR